MKEELFLLQGIESAAKKKEFDWTRHPATQAGADKLIAAGLGHKLGECVPLDAPKSRAVITSDSFYGSVPRIVIPGVEDVSVLPESGAIVVTDLPIDATSIPSPASTSAQWLAEGALADDGSMTLANISLSPMRLDANIDVSLRLLNQGGIEAQNYIVGLLVAAIWAKLESTIFGKAAASAVQPKGAFYGLAKPTVNIDTDHLLALEEEISNVKTFPGKYAFFCSQRGSTILKRTPGTVGLATRPLYDQGRLSEYPLFVTNSVASGVGSDSTGEGLLFARTTDLFIGLAGGYMILFNPFAKAKQAIVEITLSAYFMITGLRATSTDPYASTFACLPMRY